MPAWRRATWSWCRACRSPRVLRSEEPGWGSRRRRRRRRRRRARARRRHATAPAAPPAPAAIRRRHPRPPAGGDGGSVLDFANSDLAFSGQSRGHGQLPRLQHLRHREHAAAAADRLDRLPRRPGRRVGARQPAVHVGRADARPHRLRHAGRRRDGERGALPRHPHLRHHRSAEAEAGRRRSRPAAARTRTRSSPIRRTRRNIYVYGSGTGGGASGRGARRSARPAIPRRTRTPRSSASTSSRCRWPRRRRPPSSIARASSPIRRPATIAGLWPGGDHGPGTQRTSVDQSVPRHHGVPGGRPRRRRLLGQRHPARHLGSGEPDAARRGQRQELRLLALGDVQQRRHEGHLHRRVGRRHAAALPRDRSADLGRQRDLRHRRQQDEVRRLLQDAGAADRDGELRRAQRLDHSGAGPRHHGAGLVSGRPVGVRLHRFDQAGRDRVLRSRPDRREAS